jgi:glucokinase
LAQTDNLVLGVDIGGTKVAAGLVDARGQIVTKTRKPMAAQNSAEEGLAAVLRAIDTVLASDAARANSVAAIGVSTPGYVDPAAGVVRNATNLPCWRDYPLGPNISEATRLPVYLDNDGNAAALAEALWGSGAGYRSVFYVTIGTGIGSGFVIDGAVHHGRTGAAGEGGHMTIDYRGPLCLCGKRGCIEMYAAGSAIVKRARARLVVASRRASKLAQRRSAATSKMLELAEGNVQKITAEIVGKAALEGDPFATEVLQQTAESLAIWLGGIIDLLEPDVIVVGGGLGHLMASFFGYIRTQLQRWSINPRSNEIPIVSAMYGAVSGIAGAAALCRQPEWAAVLR